MDRPVKRPLFSRTSSKLWLRAGAGVRLLATLGFGLALAAGCSKSQKAQCVESSCASGQRCIQDECRSPCTVATESTDCSAGQSCAGLSFPDGTQGTYCYVFPAPDAGGSTGNTPGKCNQSSDCAVKDGQRCVNGACTIPCASHFDCGGLGECANGADSEGNAGHYCDLSTPQKPRQFYAHCPSGTDADCDTDAGFFCVGAGAGDLDAYCTTDCTTDEACAPGFACTPLTRNPCNSDCGLTGVPKDRMCVPSEQIGVGLAYQCGAHGVTRNVCRPRKFCTSCTSDTDCLAVPNQLCAADESGAKICTQQCDPRHPSCPWGNAAKCGVWDHDLNLATCAHKFGKCVGEGKSCEPCERDADCGPNNACTASSFTGEHWCVDFSVSCSCNGMAVNGFCTGGGCPQTPSGLDMQCEDDPTTTGSQQGICVGANTVNGLFSMLSSPQTGCWPSN